ncbi:GNAT family N-acetyltransferase [Pectobacterium brasiliense]|uniref:GNAT family N-acetyltransferase n=1 Tax=Pectobacterium brasiliense TaxID=180957 RepID=A0AAW9HHX1_9GAMM|nr:MULTISPECIES: GNAT family N-acetyltransferase [Pectobacterium]MDY4380033.1 GNAT family N-acetyltransferase [Pectobacterium brasiliense]PXB03825.1 N-acetyltransferase [Pectobacterium carotovorum subsp. carotovorum]
MALIFSLLDGRRHDRSNFSCGVLALDDYLQKRASQHQRDGIATTHILLDESQPTCILGYCSLSAAHLYLHELSENDRKRLPGYPVPAMRMGRLAVSTAEQKKGYGQLLLGHAVNMALSVRNTMGVRVLIVDAKDARAAAFYEEYGFRQTASEALTLYLPISNS